MEKVTYEGLFWSVFLPLTAWWILDRFFGNAWPRDSFTYPVSVRGETSFGGDRRSKSGWGPKLKEGPWAVKLYDVVARISGRFTIVGLNALVFVYMHTLHFWMMENLSEIIDFTDVRARHRIHARVGWAVVVATLVHVWSILFPCVAHGYDAEIKPGTFDLPLSERKPPGFHDVDADARKVMLQMDDVWRLGEMTVLFCVVLPLTLRWYETRYRSALKLHQTMFIAYFVDIWRRHTHPHSWVLNTPVFAAWLADLAIGHRWRRIDATVGRVAISDDYHFVCWKHDDPPPPRRVVAPLYYLKLKTQALWDRAHPFSAFANHAGIPVPPAEIADPAWDGHVVVVDRGDGLVVVDGGGDVEPSEVWHAAAVMRVYDRKASHTRVIARADESPELVVWGPFPENNVVRFALPRCSKPLLLVAGGSGISFILDYFSQFAERAAVLAFTTSDLSLFQFFCWTIRCVERRLQHAKVSVVAALTDKSVTRVVGTTTLIGAAAISRLAVSTSTICAVASRAAKSSPSPAATFKRPSAVRPGRTSATFTPGLSTTTFPRRRTLTTK